MYFFIHFVLGWVVWFGSIFKENNKKYVVAGEFPNTKKKISVLLLYCIACCWCDVLSVSTNECNINESVTHPSPGEDFGKVSH